MSSSPHQVVKPAVNTACTPHMQVLEIVKHLTGVPSFHSALHASYACTPTLSTSVPACLAALHASATALTAGTPEDHKRLATMYPDLTDPHILVYTCAMVANQMLQLLEDIHQRWVCSLCRCTILCSLLVAAWLP